MIKRISLSGFHLRVVEGKQHLYLYSKLFYPISEQTKRITQKDKNHILNVAKHIVSYSIYAFPQPNHLNEVQQVEIALHTIYEELQRLEAVKQQLNHIIRRVPVLKKNTYLSVHTLFDKEDDYCPIFYEKMIRYLPENRRKLTLDYTEKGILFVLTNRYLKFIDLDAENDLPNLYHKYVLLLKV